MQELLVLDATDSEAVAVAINGSLVDVLAHAIDSVRRHDVVVALLVLDIFCTNARHGLVPDIDNIVAGIILVAGVRDNA
mgnify:CR=1 FL=1